MFGKAYILSRRTVVERPAKGHWTKQPSAQTQERLTKTAGFRPPVFLQTDARPSPGMTI